MEAAIKEREIVAACNAIKKATCTSRVFVGCGGTLRIVRVLHLYGNWGTLVVYDYVRSRHIFRTIDLIFPLSRV